VGLRRFTHDRRGRLYLNGRRLLLRGTSFHEQVPGRGAALGPADRDAIVARLRALGATLARQHYPPHPALLEAFDRYGILFWEQIPAFKLRGSLLGAGPIQRRALGLLRDAVLRDRNHASVLTWSIANETDPPRAGEATYVRRAVALVHRYDRTRLIAADATAKVGEMPAAYRRLTAIGLNEYRGWYDDAAVERIFRTLRALHVRFPRQVLVTTEFGAEANRHGSSRTKGTYAFQRRYLLRQLRVMDRAPFLTGALVWVLRDFVVRPDWTGGNPRPDPPFTHKGLLRRDGTPKPAWSAVRRAFARFLRGRKF
jgi:beta-galactosidase/beta-glucuronidase